MKVKPTIPKGMRDFGPKEVFKRQFIINHIKQTFEKFGFLPLETPTMENLSTLTGKYGDEGDQLLFKVLDSGDYLKKPRTTIVDEEQLAYINLHLYEYLNLVFKECLKNKELSLSSLFDERLYQSDSSTFAYIYKDLLDIIDEFLKSQTLILGEYLSLLSERASSGFENFDFYYKQFYKAHFLKEDGEGIFNNLVKTIKEKGYTFFSEYSSKQLTQKISEKGLRYDLTIPFARYVAMNQNEIAFPFKRYQIQAVWRADRPQKGRYREFYQCDADVIGTDSLLPEAEIIMMIQEVFRKLGIEDYTIKINNRKVLQGLAEAFGIEDKFVDLTVAIDKLDKIGVEKVIEELASKGIENSICEKIGNFISSEFSSLEQTLNSVIEATNNNEVAIKGTDELKQVFEFVEKSSSSTSNVKFDPTLARGLNYYTGCIFEVTVNNVQIGSVSGGGRYDDLTSSFGLPNVSGVGFSFGLDRIYDVMTELDLFPKEVVTSTEALIIPCDDVSFSYSLGVLQKLRENGIKSELYPDIVKMKKSMKYANDKNIPYVVLIGSNEVESGELSFKNMETGDQQSLTIEKIIDHLK